MNGFTAKLDKLIRIVNIPLERGWSSWTNQQEYTIYRYWNQLGLLTNDDVKNLTAENARVRGNRVIANYFSSLDYYFNPEIYRDGFVADIGSGFGHITFWLLLSGAKKVYTVGDPHRVGFIRQLYNVVVEEGIIPEGSIEFVPEFVRVGHETISEKISPGSLSLVLLNDTLEHITPRILPYLARSSFADLKDGGYFISKQQNTDSPRTFAKLTVLWEKADRERYFQQRLGKITQEIPSISTAEAQTLASSTRGLDSYDFKSAVENFRSRRILPQHDLNIPAIDIDLDVPDEGDTTIKRITSELSKAGFKNIKVFPALLDSRVRGLFQPIAKNIPGLFLNAHLLDETTVFQARKLKQA